MVERDELGFLPPEEFDVTCHTDGCENAGITLRVLADPENTNVSCGPCGQRIADVTPVGGMGE